MRLIDADVLLQKIKTLGRDAGFYKPIYDGFISIIENAPIVNAEPVRQGWWIKGENWALSCSECGCLGIAHDGKEYCSYCGAKMDGGMPNENA